MALSRRDFIRACGGAAAALAASSLPLMGLAVGRKVWMIPELTMALFEGYVGETFHVRSAEGPVELTLARVMETPTRHRDDPRGATRTEGFCVYFEGSPDAGLMQGMHTFTHDGMGEVELFMTPVASPKPEVCRYEVVINRLIEA